MKKCIAVFSLLFALSLGMIFATPRAAEAAVTYPVYDAHASYINYEVANAKAVNNRTYLPLRTLFEYYDASVDWDQATKTITAKRCDGTVITMKVGSKNVTVKELGETKNYAMDVVPLIEKGTTYVPVRFVAENLLCDVEWNNDEKAVYIYKQYATAKINGCKYTVIAKTCEVREVGADGTTKSLGKSADLAEYKEYFTYVASGIDRVSKTANGNYLLTLDFCPMDPPAETVIMLYIDSKGQNNQFYETGSGSAGSYYGSYCVSGINVWFPQEDGVLKINDQTSQVEQSYKYADLLKNHDEFAKTVFTYSDGSYMLLGCQENGYWDGPVYLPLINLQTGEITELTTKILPAADNGYYFFGGSKLTFEKAGSGTLYFKYYNNDLNPKEQTLTYKYK